MNRYINKLYAKLFGYFWLPCPICGEMFGGHECTKAPDGFDNAIIDYDKTDIESGGVYSLSICQSCSEDGLGSTKHSINSILINQFKDRNNV